MNKKQIRRDYKNVDYVDEKGKVRTRVEYIGATYEMVKPQKKGFTISYSLLAVFSLVFFIPPLVLNGNSLRAIYVTMPFVLQIFPIFLLLLGGYKLLTSKFPIREEVKSNVFSRPRVASIFGVILASISTISFFIYIGTNDESGVDYVTLASCVCEVVVFVLFYLDIKRTELLTIPHKPDIDGDNKDDAQADEENRGEESADESEDSVESHDDNAI